MNESNADEGATTLPTAPSTNQENSTHCPIPGYPGFAVSRDGSVYGAKGRKLTAAVNARGYHFVSLGRGHRWYVHRLIAFVFLGPCPDKYEVNHRDTDKGNNAVSNLEYVTSAENKAHAYQHGLTRHAGEQNASHTLTDQDVREIRELGASGMLQKEIAERYGVRKQTIGSILRGELWKHIDGPLSRRGHAGQFNSRFKGGRSVS